MALIEILFGTSVLLFIILVVLILIPIFKPNTKSIKKASPKSDLEKIKAQIGE